MLKIDDRNYSQEEVADALENLSLWLEGQTFPIARLAVCTTDVFDWLLLVFYCRQRGLSTQDAVNMIVNGYCKEVFKHLPMEFAVEAQKLLGVSLEGSVG